MRAEKSVSNAHEVWKDPGARMVLSPLVVVDDAAPIPPTAFIGSTGNVVKDDWQSTNPNGKEEIHALNAEAKMQAVGIKFVLLRAVFSAGF